MSRKPPGYWDDWKNVEEALRQIIKDLGRFPTKEWMRANGHSNLEVAIGRHHGGLDRSRERMGFRGRVVRGYWQQWKHCEAKLREIMNDLGKFPRPGWLSANGYGGLADAISTQHGGFVQAHKQMGISGGSERGLWVDRSVCEAELRKIASDIGRFPDSRWLTKNGHLGLMTAIFRHHGGINSARSKLGYLEVNESHLRNYADQIAEVFMRDPGDAESFENFLAGLERDCRYERDLRVRLGLPPEPPTLREAEIGAPTDNVGAEPTEDQ